MPNRSTATTTTMSARKAERIAAQEKRHASNVAAGKMPKVRRRPKRDNMRLCTRCHTRTILAGSVCWCSSLDTRKAR